MVKRKDKKFFLFLWNCGIVAYKYEDEEVQDNVHNG